MSVPTRRDFEEAFMDMDEDTMRDMFFQLRQHYEEQQVELDKAHRVCRVAYNSLLSVPGGVNSDGICRAQRLLMDFTVGRLRDNAAKKLGYEDMLEDDEK